MPHLFPRIYAVFGAICLFLLIGVQARADDSSAYLLDSEDVFAVLVQRHPELSGDFLVPVSGSVDLPGVGTVRVAGISLGDLAKTIADRLKKDLLDPEVSVTLKTPRLRRVYVLGEVGSPGIYDLKRGWGVAEMVTAAGGVRNGIQRRDVRITIQSVSRKESRTLSMDEVLDPARRLVLEPGDVVQVQTVETVPIYVSGKVKAPGLYQFRSDSTGILEVLTQAGGLTDDGSMANVRIIRAQGGDEVVDLTPVLVHGQKKDLPTVGRGDMVIVPELMTRFMVLGYVSKPGFFNIPSGQSYTLLDVLALASGSPKGAKWNQVGLLRIEGGKEIRTVFDVGKYLSKGDSTQNPAIRPGDIVYVPENNKKDFASVLGSLSSSLFIFNGLFR